ncbi:hypothetical protein K438DRAFT_1962006 [Mycena galopus ATCC 62051]|nr:hypothetical protein K438DRAFT_1962006 [Mycena galopus ATCC 62051]
MTLTDAHRFTDEANQQCALIEMHVLRGQRLPCAARLSSTASLPTSVSDQQQQSVSALIAVPTTTPTAAYYPGADAGREHGGQEYINNDGGGQEYNSGGLDTSASSAGQQQVIDASRAAAATHRRMAQPRATLGNLIWPNGEQLTTVQYQERYYEYFNKAAQAAAQAAQAAALAQVQAQLLPTVPQVQAPVVLGNDNANANGGGVRGVPFPNASAYAPPNPYNAPALPASAVNAGSYSVDDGYGGGGSGGNTSPEAYRSGFHSSSPSISGVGDAYNSNANASGAVPYYMDESIKIQAARLWGDRRHELVRAVFAGSESASAAAAAAAARRARAVRGGAAETLGTRRDSYAGQPYGQGLPHPSKAYVPGLYSSLSRLCADQRKRVALGGVRVGEPDARGYGGGGGGFAGRVGRESSASGTSGTNGSGSGSGASSGGSVRFRMSMESA